MFAKLSVEVFCTLPRT